MNTSGDYKIIIYQNTACAERRPETIDDARDDWTEWTQNYDSDIEAMQDVYAECHPYYDEEDLEEEFEDMDSVDDFIASFENQDWGDGTPFVIRIEGPNGVIFDSGYKSLEDWISEGIANGYYEDDEYDIEEEEEDE